MSKLKIPNDLQEMYEISGSRSPSGWSGSAVRLLIERIARLEQQLKSARRQACENAEQRNKVKKENAIFRALFMQLQREERKIECPK